MSLLTQVFARFVVCTYLIMLFGASIAAHASSTLFQQRNSYSSALAHLRAGQISQFNQLASTLDDYVLKPYLDYHRLNTRLSIAKADEVTQFYQRHAALPVADRLYRRWLKLLGKRRQWSTLLNHHLPEQLSYDTELNCYYLRALYGTGAKQQALDGATELWRAPKSQPKACDPLFEVWRGTSRFNEDIAWERLDGAIQANQRSLARYLLRFFTNNNKLAADAYYNVHVNPKRVARTGSYRSDTDRFRALIIHGLKRLASRDAGAAERAWKTYQRSHQFSEQQRQFISDRILVALAQEGQYPNLQSVDENTSVFLISGIADAAISRQQWSQAGYWIDQLPAAEKQKLRWQYWLARALTETMQNSERAQLTYRSLATQRQYYGFLAASRLGLPGQLNAAPNTASESRIAQVRRIPAMARSIELFAVGDEINGRREWYRALDNMPLDQQIAAGTLAYRMGYIPLGIRTANLAEATDHLHLRFPQPYQTDFRQAGHRTGIAPSLLFAMARQESAFDHRARSSADARGLMQLLPSTARLVARRARAATPSNSDLHNPAVNIRLGSYHLAWLLKRYDDQSPLAIAAYNAGEHRVDRWIKDKANTPMDVWIEDVPFAETRNYVKNVLAFRHVYAQRLADPAPLLSVNEQYVRIPNGRR